MLRLKISSYKMRNGFRIAARSLTMAVIGGIQGAMIGATQRAVGGGSITAGAIVGGFTGASAGFAAGLISSAPTQLSDPGTIYTNMVLSTCWGWVFGFTGGMAMSHSIGDTGPAIAGLAAPVAATVTLISRFLPRRAPL